MHASLHRLVQVQGGSRVSSYISQRHGSGPQSQSTVSTISFPTPIAALVLQQVCECVGRSRLQAGCRAWRVIQCKQATHSLSSNIDNSPSLKHGTTTENAGRAQSNSDALTSLRRPRRGSYCAMILRMAEISAFCFSGVLQNPCPPCFVCTVVPFKRTSKFPVLPSSLFICTMIPLNVSAMSSFSVVAFFSYPQPPQYWISTWFCFSGSAMSGWSSLSSDELQQPWWSARREASTRGMGSVHCEAHGQARARVHTPSQVVGA